MNIEQVTKRNPLKSNLQHTFQDQKICRFQRTLSFTAVTRNTPLPGLCQENRKMESVRFHCEYEDKLSWRHVKMSPDPILFQITENYLCTAQTSLIKTSPGKIYCHHKMSLEANYKKEIFFCYFYVLCSSHLSLK